MSEVAGPVAAEIYVVDSPYEVANWRPLAHWVLYIPHAIIQYGLRTLAGVAFLVYWVMLIFTGRLHRGLFGLMVLYERYSQRTDSYLVGFSEVYPPFDFHMGSPDNDAYPPIKVNLPEPPETASRWAALNFILAIPHLVVLVFFMIAAFVVAIMGWFAVLFTGHWPQGPRDFLVRVTNYYLRVWTYVVMIEPNYPRFGI